MALQSMRPKTASSRNAIVRKPSNRLPKKFLMNAAATMVAISIAGLGAYSAIVKDEALQCSDRFSNGTLFGLQQNSGAALSIVDLQARLAGRDWGLLENAKILNITDGPSSVALQVALPVVNPKAADDETPTRSGMGFTWSPAKLSTAAAACLTYSVWLPDGFEFGPGGGLPGLFGGPTADEPGRSAQSLFVTRYRWRNNGQAEMRAITAEMPEGTSLAIDPDWMKFERGKWMRLEQEVVLNRPGARDGILRVWINGRLKLENKRMAYRVNDKAAIRGVVADVHYSTPSLAMASGPKSTMLRLTPFELRWQ